MFSKSGTPQKRAGVPSLSLPAPLFLGSQSLGCLFFSCSAPCCSFQLKPHYAGPTVGMPCVPGGPRNDAMIGAAHTWWVHICCLPKTYQFRGVHLFFVHSRRVRNFQMHPPFSMGHSGASAKCILLDIETPQNRKPGC